MTTLATQTSESNLLRGASEAIAFAADPQHATGETVPIAARLAAAVEQHDLDGVHDELHELRHALGMLCTASTGHGRQRCCEVLDEPREEGSRYCSRECWARDGGDL